MKPTVHILATCRNPELIRATTLVFDTLRRGFPTSRIKVHINAMDGLEYLAVADAANRQDCTVTFIKDRTIHHEWIKGLLATETQPFIILDTDLVFWANCEDWDYAGAALSGRFIPEFYDQFTKCVTRARLHGSFLYLDPARIAVATAQFKTQFPDTPFNPMADLVNPIMVPGKPHSHFHDTCCLLYQSIGGRPFGVDRLECYDHLNCGTISDIVGPHLKDLRLREAHFAVFENPALAKGAWRDEERYFLAHQPYE